MRYVEGAKRVSTRAIGGIEEVLGANCLVYQKRRGDEQTTSLKRWLLKTRTDVHNWLAIGSTMHTLNFDR